jgi:hypothetical protein
MLSQIETRPLGAGRAQFCVSLGVRFAVGLDGLKTGADEAFHWCGKPDAATNEI